MKPSHLNTISMSLSPMRRMRLWKILVLAEGISFTAIWIWSHVLNSDVLAPQSPTSKYIHSFTSSKHLLLYPSKEINTSKICFSPPAVHYLGEGAETYKEYLNLFGQLLFWDSHENCGLSRKKITQADTQKSTKFLSHNHSLEYFNSRLFTEKGVG